MREKREKRARHVKAQREDGCYLGGVTRLGVVRCTLSASLTISLAWTAKLWYAICHTSSDHRTVHYGHPETRPRVPIPRCQPSFPKHGTVLTLLRSPGHSKQAQPVHHAALFHSEFEQFSHCGFLCTWDEHRGTGKRHGADDTILPLSQPELRDSRVMGNLLNSQPMGAVARA